MYKRLNQQLVLRLRDNAEIPDDPANIDFQELQTYLLAGGNIQPEDPPAPRSPEVIRMEEDKAAAKRQLRLAALADMTPAQVTTWVSQNVTNFGDAKELLTALAIAVSILSRNF